MSQLVYHKAPLTSGALLRAPARPKYDPERFSTLTRGLLDRFDTSYQDDRNILLNHGLGSLVQTLRNEIIYVQPPLSGLARSV